MVQFSAVSALVASLERSADMLNPDHDDPAAVFDHIVELSGEPLFAV
jgi:hypothetical protein